MTYWAMTRSGGLIPLGDPQEAVMSFDRDAPADQLKAVFPAGSLWEDIFEVRVYEGGRGVFRGVVDEQITKLTSAGLTVELVCRSREALLLDSEAEPATIKRPSLESIYTRLLKPLGFSGISGSEASVPGELRIEKGASCWQVLSGFCREQFGTEPFVDFDGVIHCEGVEKRQLELSGVMSARIDRLPCKRLSTVWKQGYRGGYDTLYSDPEAPVVRERYVSAQSGVNPRELLEKSKEQSALLTVVCSGSRWPLRGAQASVAVPGVGRFQGRPVQKGVCYRGRDGEKTRLVLEMGDVNVAD